MNIFMGVPGSAGARHSANISAMIDLSNLSSRWRGDNIIISRLFCIHLFEPAGCLIFFCVDYTFMTQFSAITGLRLPLSDFLSQPTPVLSYETPARPRALLRLWCPPLHCYCPNPGTNGDSTNSAAVLTQLVSSRNQALQEPRGAQI